MKVKISQSLRSFAMTPSFCRLVPVLLCVCLILLWSVQGCGKKGDPRPTAVPPPVAVSDLRATRIESGVYLRWSIPDAKGGIQNFKIQRNEQDKERYSCVDCPREFVMIADISVNDRALKKEEGNSVGYLDLQVKEGYFYAYQIIACDMARHCSEASNIEEIKISMKVPQGREGVKSTNQ
jgi:hypothetical protein